MIKQVITIQGIGVAVWRGGFGRGKVRIKGMSNIEQGMSNDEVFRWERAYCSSAFLGYLKFSITNAQCSIFKGEECRTDEQGILNVEGLGRRGFMIRGFS